MESVNPKIALDNVFVFHIGTLNMKRANNYEATRYSWKIFRNNRNLLPAYAVGLIDKMSHGSYIIKEWVDSDYIKGKHAFISPNHPSPELFTPLVNQNWSKVINAALGFYLHGGYLIVQFDGKGKFRVKRGSKDKSTWHNC